MNIIVYGSGCSGLSEIIREHCPQALIECAGGEEEFLNIIDGAAKAFDIAFIDLDSGFEPGITAALKAKSAFPAIKIIFICSTAENCEKAFMKMKPDGFIAGAEAAHANGEKRCLFRREAVCYHLDCAGKSRENTVLCIDSNRRNYSVSLDKVTFIECDRNKITVHFGSETLCTICSLKRIEEQLNSDFIKCHQSYIVNIKHIAADGEDYFRLDSGETVPISRSKKAESRFLFRQHRLNNG